VEDDEAIKESIVLADGLGDLRPACRTYGGAVEECWEFEECVADMSAVCGGWSAETGEEGFGLRGGKDWERIWWLLVKAVWCEKLQRKKTRGR